MRLVSPQVFVFWMSGHDGDGRERILVELEHENESESLSFDLTPLLPGMAPTKSVGISLPVRLRN